MALLSAAGGMLRALSRRAATGVPGALDGAAIGSGGCRDRGATKAFGPYELAVTQA